MEFIKMVSEVIKALPSETVIAVHCHNDLGMATATTVESYFAGAGQLECSLNGLGERTGNTNMYEVAVSLHNCGVNLPLDLSKIYETALVVSEMSNIPIFEKSPLIGQDALAHRSGIHQDGAAKTKDMKKGAYRPIHPSLIGRDDDEHLGFTSQSGKTAIYEIIKRAGYPVTIEEAVRLVPFAKEKAEKIGELPVNDIIDIYFKEIFNVQGPFKLAGFKKVDENETYKLHFFFKDEEYSVVGQGEGPLEACLDALTSAGYQQKLLHYEQLALGEEVKGVSADAMTVIHLAAETGETIICRGKDPSTAKANVKAIFNGLNLVYKLKNPDYAVEA
jgi:2-isopropylmalate synthase